MNEQLAQTGFQAGSKNCYTCQFRSEPYMTEGGCNSCTGWQNGYSNWKADPKTLAGYIDSIYKDECHFGDSDLKCTPIPQSEHDVVNNPSHYTEGRSIEPIDAITDWELNFCLGNVVKYVSRAGRKNSALEDLKKARFYLDYHIKTLEQK